MKRRKMCSIAILLMEALLLGGCGRTAAVVSVPVLMEPVAANAAFRPVETGAIGETQVLYGTVVPMEYCAFYDTDVTIENITVEVGDYVEEGDVVAYVDIHRLKTELEDLNLQLEYVKQTYELNMKIDQLRAAQSAEMYDAEIALVRGTVSGNDALPEGETGEGEIPHTVSGGDAVTDSEQEKALAEHNKLLEDLYKEKDAAIKVALENLQYDAILHEYRVQNLCEEISAKRKVIEEGTLRASHSGYVVYVKNLNVMTEAAAYENIVVVADPEETYIELKDMNLSQYAYKDYENYEIKEVRIAGEAYNVTELSYGTEAEVFAKAAQKYPNVRLVCREVSELTIGETYPILYREHDMGKEPVIGWDSLEGEEGAYFVYVKGEDGSKEKRSVSIGETDQYYVQILDGLAVGEMVYYESDALMPVNYTEYTVELSDYSIDNVTRSYQAADEPVVWYDAEYAGSIQEIAVKVGDKVEKGDLLYVMRSDAREAALADARNKINQENKTYEETIGQLDKSLAVEGNEIAAKIFKFQRELETVMHEYRLHQLEEAYGEMKKNNDGNGMMRVYAKEGGTVMRIPVNEYGGAEESYVTQGMHVLSVGKKAEDKLLVQMVEIKDSQGNMTERSYPDNIAEFGENITITIGDSEERVYRGVCTGRTAQGGVNLNKHYITEAQDDIKISFCTDSGYDKAAFYVEMEDEEFYQNMPKQGKVTFSYVEMEAVTVVPAALVKEETNSKNPNKTNYYVWRVMGEELVKQYVLINKEYSDTYSVLVLSGVEAGDVLAWER